jgi:2-amino-4-hydroxy-6-hydroxymethyldihydropteridine diphosphokinase
MFERAFVLVPLAEIAGAKPIAGRSIAQALRALDTTGIEKLPR